MSARKDEVEEKARVTKEHIDNAVNYLNSQQDRDDPGMAYGLGPVFRDKVVLDKVEQTFGKNGDYEIFLKKGYKIQSKDVDLSKLKEGKIVVGVKAASGFAECRLTFSVEEFLKLAGSKLKIKI